METSEEVLRLSAEERLRLIEKLWDSLVDEHGEQLEVSAAIKAELDRRLAAHERAPGELLSWSEIRQQLRDVE